MIRALADSFPLALFALGVACVVVIACAVVVWIERNDRQ